MIISTAHRKIHKIDFTRPFKNIFECCLMFSPLSFSSWLSRSFEVSYKLKRRKILRKIPINIHCEVLIFLWLFVVPWWKIINKLSWKSVVCEKNDFLWKMWHICMRVEEKLQNYVKYFRDFSRLDASSHMKIIFQEQILMEKPYKKERIKIFRHSKKEFEQGKDEKLFFFSILFVQLSISSDLVLAVMCFVLPFNINSPPIFFYFSFIVNFPRSFFFYNDEEFFIIFVSSLA